LPEPTHPDLTALWEGVREELRAATTPSSFESWLEPLRPVGLRGGRLYVCGPDRVREWFERRYLTLAVEAARRQAPDISEIVFSDPDSDPHPRAESALPAGLERDLDFDRFVIGRGNRFAHAAALAVAELPGEAYNPLFLYGEPGLGKTHLLVAIATYLQRRRPDVTVVYTTAERFTTEFVTAVRTGGPSGAERFKQRYRTIGALLIDDVQFLENKPKTEEEFFHTFNELYASGSQLVLSSDRPPEALAALTERLRDRFAWGLTVQLQAPDLPTRVALLRRLASDRAIPVADPEALRRIALATPTNLRKLEGALTRVAAYSSLVGRPPCAELVAEALTEVGRTTSIGPGEGGLGIEAIQRAVCGVLHVSAEELRSPRRRPNLVRARQLGMYVARNQTTLSLAEIARAFNRDHSTVLHSIRAIEKRLEPGSDIHRALEAIQQRLQLDPESA
jgi:chromosomal replication initiator protein